MNNSKIYFQVVDINKAGLTLQNTTDKIYISFLECAKNHAREHNLSSSTCVATRDITKLTFTFYTVPKVKVIFKKNFLKDLFSEQSAIDKFFELKNAINTYGYTSYDFS